MGQKETKRDVQFLRLVFVFNQPLSVIMVTKSGLFSIDFVMTLK